MSMNSPFPGGDAGRNIAWLQAADPAVAEHKAEAKAAVLGRWSLCDVQPKFVKILG